MTSNIQKPQEISTELWTTFICLCHFIKHLLFCQLALAYFTNIFLKNSLETTFSYKATETHNRTCHFYFRIIFLFFVVVCWVWIPRCEGPWLMSTWPNLFCDNWSFSFCFFYFPFYFIVSYFWQVIWFTETAIHL